MIRGVITLCVGCLFLLFFSPAGNAQTTDPGIRVVENKVKTTIYEVRVEGMFAPEHATKLDNNFLQKEAVISASTNYQDKVCRIEALSIMGESYIRDVVEFSGFKVAKAFNP